MVESHQTTYLQDPENRLEAGEGWHEDGLNKTVLGAIGFRQALTDEFRDTQHRARRRVPVNLHEELFSQIDHVEMLKERFGLTNPPIQLGPNK